VQFVSPIVISTIVPMWKRADILSLFVVITTTNEAHILQMASGMTMWYMDIFYPGDKSEWRIFFKMFCVK